MENAGKERKGREGNDRKGRKVKGRTREPLKIWKGRKEIMPWRKT